MPLAGCRGRAPVEVKGQSPLGTPALPGDGDADVLRAEDVGAVAGVEIEAESSVGGLDEMGSIDELRHPTSVAGRGDEGTRELEMHAVIRAQQADGGLAPLPHAIDAVLDAGVTVGETVDNVGSLNPQSGTNMSPAE